VTTPSDDVAEMPPAPEIDDPTIEAIVRGDDVAVEVRDLAMFAAHVRAVADRPPSRPSTPLARLFADGLPAVGRAAPVAAEPARARRRSRPGRRHLARTGPPRRARRTLARALGVGLVAKLSLGATAAAVAGAGASGVLPGPAGRAVRGAIEVVTPVEFTDGDPAPAGPGGAHAPSPGTVRPDAAGDEPDAAHDTDATGGNGDRVSGSWNDDDGDDHDGDDDEGGANDDDGDYDEGGADEADDVPDSDRRRDRSPTDAPGPGDDDTDDAGDGDVESDAAERNDAAGGDPGVDDAVDRGPTDG
jgi:hypothetical protein